MHWCRGNSFRSNSRHPWTVYIMQDHLSVDWCGAPFRCEHDIVIYNNAMCALALFWCIYCVLCCTRISFTSSIAERCTTPGCPRPSTRWTRCRRLAELILSSTRSWVLFRPRTPVSKENSTRLQWRIMALVSRLMGAVGSSPSSNSSTGSLGSCPNIKKHGEESVAEFGVEFYAKISSHTCHCLLLWRQWTE